ncbi:hypothetical protein ACFL5W_01830 [Thermodesulfobacteriota bacterium]
MRLDAAVVRLLEDQALLKHHISGVLEIYAQQHIDKADPTPETKETSAVLFLLGGASCRPASGKGPCLILNKRSPKVKQPGDLCCPGGGIDSRIDPIVARLLSSPLSPLRRWPAWERRQRRHKTGSRQLALLLAASLREGLEEMRLNPFGFEFLGILPPQRLVMFKREIYPLVGWVARQKRFFPNWEVADVVYLPLRNLLDSGRYARYQLEIETDTGHIPYDREFPCFLQEQNGQAEVLWGATFRIAMVFLALVFGFEPPEMAALPVKRGVLRENYFR